MRVYIYKTCYGISVILHNDGDVAIRSNMTCSHSTYRKVMQSLDSVTVGSVSCSVGCSVTLSHCCCHSLLLFSHGFGIWH